jgi:DNA adenine methylase
MKPFLKWPGGKRWAVKCIVEKINRWLGPGGTYYELFLGSGAVFFALMPHTAVLSDINGDLINTFMVVRDYPDQVRRALRRIPVNRHTYYTIRNSKPRTIMSKAVRFLYLNRTAFAGLYRLNNKGQFNVPFNGGERDASALFETSILEDAAVCLQNAEMLESDFEPILKMAGAGDVVYCDATYTVKHTNNGFARYNEIIFSWHDQVRLFNAAGDAATRGATVIVSNTCHSSINKLYKNAKRITLARTSTICPNPNHRIAVKESLFILRKELMNS